jgi:hypothetical protein
MAFVCSLQSHADTRAHRPWRRVGPRALCALRLVHVYARLARFGAYGAALAIAAYMLAVRLADARGGVDVQPGHRRLERSARGQRGLGLRVDDSAGGLLPEGHVHRVGGDAASGVPLVELALHEVCVYTYNGCICIHAYAHAFIHTYMYTYIHTYIPTYLQAYIHTCIHTYIYTYIHRYMHAMHACMHTYIRTYVHTYMHTYVRTYIHTIACMLACIHAYMHTYVRTYVRACVRACVHTYVRMYTMHACSQLVLLRRGARADGVERHVLRVLELCVRSTTPSPNPVLTAITDANIATAVTAWVTSPTTALTTYGNIGDWDVSRVSNMAHLLDSSYTERATFNADISKWNTASVSTMTYVCSMPSHADMRAYCPWRRLEPRALCALRLVHVCAQLACFGAYGAGLALVACMLAVRLADVL